MCACFHTALQTLSSPPFRDRTECPLCRAGEVWWVLTPQQDRDRWDQFLHSGGQEVMPLNCLCDDYSLTCEEKHWGSTFFARGADVRAAFKREGVWLLLGDGLVLFYHTVTTFILHESVGSLFIRAWRACVLKLRQWGHPVLPLAPYNSTCVLSHLLRWSRTHP